MGRYTRAALGALVGAALAASCAGPEGERLRAGPPAPVPPPATPAPPVPPPALPPEPAPADEMPPSRPAYLPAGVHEHQAQVDGHTRRWTTVVPERPDGTVPTGIVVALHGVGGRGVDMRSAGFEPRAATSGMVVAYPDALGGAWNDGRPGADPVVPGVDDTRFLRLVIEETAARTGADRRRVAVVGFSAGGVMAARVACDLADGVVAVALVGGFGGQGFEQSCRPARPVAVMLVAGSNDRTVPYGGGRVADWGTRRRGYVAAVEDVFAFWRTSDGCAATQVVPGAGSVSEARGTGCTAGTSVVRYRVSGGGHEWFRPPTFDTTGAVWDFVARRFAAIA